MVVNIPAQLMSDEQGYNFFVSFYNRVAKLEHTEVILDFSDNWWFEANLCAALGAILSNVQENLNEIKFQNLNSKLEDILTRNHFLSYFMNLYLPDKNRTTIKFRKFKVTEEKQFKDYLDEELLSQPDLPNMSPLLKNKINKSIFEIYNNAYIHGKCSHVYTCGQYYPQKKKLDFTIADLGKSIKYNVNNYLKSSLTGTDAIKWAIEEGNTTKTGSIPGGLGLSLILEFLRLNNGKIQIVSSDGYWEEKKGIIFATDFDLAFVGTIVNLEFNINDHSSYILKEELNPESIF